MVFSNETTTLTAALAGCKSEAFLWAARLPREDAAIGSIWSSVCYASRMILDGGFIQRDATSTSG